MTTVWTMLRCRVLPSKLLERGIFDKDSKIQRVPSAPGYETLDRPRVVIPKRGEKDFEPMYQTVNLQEMMLQRSREALFSALAGVRGGNRCIAASLC